MLWMSAIRIRFPFFGNDAVGRYRSFPGVGFLKPRVRDAVWAEDTVFGGMDWRVFAGTDDFCALQREAWERWKKAEEGARL